MLNLLLRDGLWFFSATGIGLLSAIGLIVIGRREHAPSGVTITAALNLFFGVWIGIMGTGHLFAVTTKALLGVLRPDINLWFAIPFGLAIAVPGWSLVGQARALLRQNERSNSQAMWLNAWLALVLIVPGFLCVASAKQLTEGQTSAWRRACWATLWLLVVNLPLILLNGFGTALSTFALVNLVSLGAISRRLGIRVRQQVG